MKKKTKKIARKSSQDAQRREKKTPPSRAKPSPDATTPAARQRNGQIEPQEPLSDAPVGNDFPIVAVGASAGGLEAFSQLLESLSPDLGMSVVLVQHLSPQHASLLSEILAAHSVLPVREVNDGMPLAPNHVYVIPPDKTMTLVGHVLKLTPRPAGHVHHAPIDAFFCSVAEHSRERGIGIILSGTATDGVIGVKAIKIAGGITFAQEPASAKFDGMPRAAIATDMIDLVLTPAEIGAELSQLAKHPLLKSDLANDRSEDLRLSDEQLERVFQTLRGVSGVDFTHYKSPTVRRRLQRRMMLHKLASVEHYVRYLEDNPAEAQSLYYDVLIHVTKFFREPDSFEALKKQVFPKLVAQRKGEAPIRVWTPGCSSGEEPYSVAMALLEYLEEHNLQAPIQIFATDVSETVIDRARSGIYPENIAAEVSAERLRRFFNRSDGSYQLTKSVRDLCVFARQDLTRDPPFSKLDLIVCRNVLIYMGGVLQKKLMNVFHYALKSHGYLLLGHAETVGQHVELFSIVDKKHRLYLKKAVDTPAAKFPIDYQLPRRELLRRSTAASPASESIQSEVSRLLLDKYTPAGVVVDADLQIVQFRGQTGPFLEPAPGDASLNLMKMAREGLVYGLRTALRAARKADGPLRRDGLRVRHDGRTIDVDLEVVPLGVGEGRHFLILFHERSSQPGASHPDHEVPKAKRGSERQRGAENELTRLQQELAASREYMQSIIQDLEAANEELQSANEEILSSNEELQSTNEELDTAKEELQSTNEELNTLNEELHGRNEELSRVNSDLINLLGSVQIAIVMVSGDLRIRRFTPMAERILNLIPADVGRPIGHIKPNIDCADLEQLIGEVVDTMTIMDREVRDRQGHWYSLRVRPYKNVENRIDGAVLALFDIHASKHHEEQSAEAGALAEAMLESLPEPVLLLTHELAVYNANQAWKLRFGWPSVDPLGMPLSQFQNGVWNLPELNAMFLELASDREGLPAGAKPTKDERRAPEVTCSCLLSPAQPVRFKARRFAAKGLEKREVILLSAEPL